MVIDDPGEVLAILTDDGCPVPPVPAAAGTGVAWLRAHVVRFSSGTEHRRRRALAEARLARVAPERLRGPEPAVALAEALGLQGIRAAAVAAVAGVYQPWHEPTPEADAAVAELAGACGGAADKDTAATICLLVQAHQATHDLVTTTLRAGTTVAETLRTDPPVRRTRRLRGGRVVEVDLGTQPFGAGAHACPGRAHAIALAENIVAACSHDGTKVAAHRATHPATHPAARPAPAPPADHALRDGQIYRWVGGKVG
ncbi:MAG TPA: hypothetical protein VGP26_19260 [Actinophytocola sp.]|jgi:hypothetical protein|nr:hypothetical protein [Actinophytocola sp.]